MAGTLIVEMSTVAPQTHIDLAKMTEAAGGRFIECPVSGSVSVAREKRLLGFAGGAAGDVERARPMLDGLCRRVDHVGAVGAGGALKLAINLPLIMYWQVLGEALAICEPYGFDPDWLIGLFSESSGGPNVLKVRGPSIAKSLTGEAVPVTADLNTFLKDVGLMLDAAKADGNTSPMVEQARTVFAAAQNRGLGEIDCSAFPAYWAKKGKTELLGGH
jgi:3-hydroxyisobutyrate dehydrogenase